MAAGYGYFKWLMNQASFVSTMTLVSLSLLVLLVNVGLTTAAEQSSSRKLGVTPLSACKVQLDDGRIVDLSSLDDASNPKTDVEANYVYKFNPCTGYKCSDSTNSAVCQASKDQKYIYDLGDQTTAVFDYDDTAVSIKYSAGERKSLIQCMCGSGADSLKFINENPSRTYNLRFTSKCCCPDGCKGGKGGGLSFGSILLIIFFSLLAVYIIGGFIFTKFVQKKSGKETILFVDRLETIPGNIIGGFKFTLSKVTGKGGSGYNQL